jgi:hypothetical protein
MRANSYKPIKDATNIDEIFDEAYLLANRYVESGEEISPHSLVLYKDKHYDIVHLIGESKTIKPKFIKTLIESDIIGYVVVWESQFQDKNGVVISMYTPKISKKKIIFYKNNTIIGREEIIGRENFEEDSMDIWGNFNTGINCYKNENEN